MIFLDLCYPSSFHSPCNLMPSIGRRSCEFHDSFSPKGRRPGFRQVVSILASGQGLYSCPGILGNPLGREGHPFPFL